MIVLQNCKIDSKKFLTVLFFAFSHSIFAKKFLTQLLPHVYEKKEIIFFPKIMTKGF